MRAERFTEEQIIGVLKEAEAGAKPKELCRKHGISDQTLYNWKATYGGMTVPEARRLKELAVRRRKRKRIGPVERHPLLKPVAPNVSWSMDFIADGLSNGRRFRCLAIVADFSRECLAIEVDTSLPGPRVAAVLDRLAADGGLPESITVDNGPEFDGRVLDEWAYRNPVRLAFIRPGKPNENAYIESWNGKKE